MTQSNKATREFVSAALSYALRNSADEFYKEISHGSQEHDILNALDLPIICDTEDYIKNTIMKLKAIFQ